MTTITTFATAVDVTIAELKLEAFLPADPETAVALNRAHGYLTPTMAGLGGGTTARSDKGIN
jgi:hypothetical protein